MLKPLLAALLLLGPVAAADEPADPSVLWSFAAGLTTGLVPLAIGGGLTTRVEQATQDAGVQVIVSGLALAPIVSHLVAREWKRAAAFGAVPVAAAIGMAIFLSQVPDVLSDIGQPDTRIPFGGLIILSLLSSTVGLTDSLLAGERAHRARAPSRPPRIAVVPLWARGSGGLGVVGAW